MLTALKPRAWIPALAFLVALLAIGATGLLLFERHALEMERTAHNQLAAVADLKVEQIDQWMGGQRRDAEVISRDNLLAEEVERWFEQDAPEGVMAQKFLVRLKSLMQIYRYASIVLLDTKAQPRLHVGSELQFHPNDTNLALQAMRKNNMTSSDIHWSDDQEPEMDMVAPLAVSSASGLRVIGAVYFRIDPGVFFFPYIQSWPSPSPSAETFLVRRDGNEVLFLNELRHRKGTALRLRLPIDDPLLPAAMALRGEAKVAEGKDYRGVLVIAAARKVPDTPWILLAKQDRAEVQAPIRSFAATASGLVALFMLLAGIIAALWWRKQHAQSLAALSEEKLQRKALEQHFDYATKLARDIILLFDETGRLVECNDAAPAAYGYTREALLQLTLSELCAAQAVAAIPGDLEKAALLGGRTFETAHRRKDGSSLPVEVSMQLIEIEGRRFYQSIARDITERKQAEEGIRRLLRARMVMSDCNHVLIHASDEMQMLQDMCRIAVEVGGYQLIWIDFAEQDAECSVRPVTWAGVELGHFKGAKVSWADNEHGRSPAGTTIRTGKTHFVQDALTDPAFAPWREQAIQYGSRSIVALPLTVDGVCIGAISIQAKEVNAFDSAERELLEELASDIGFGIGALRVRARHKTAEEALQKSEANYRNLTENLDELVYRADPDTLIASYVNSATERIYGYTVEDWLKDPTLFESALHPEDRERVLAKFTEARRTLESVDLQYRVIRKDKTVRWVEDRANWEKDQQGNAVSLNGVLYDITERKRAEDAARRLAYFDALTGLPNRTRFSEHLARAVAQAETENKPLAVLLLDIVDFHEVVAAMGFAQSEKLLQDVAQRLQPKVDDGAMLARVGTDEFAILLAGADARRAAELARTLLREMERPFEVSDASLDVHASIGIALYPGHGTEADALFLRAGIAAIEGKQKGSDYTIYAGISDAESPRRLVLISELRHAIESDQLILHYQPKIDIGSGRVCGAEALVRWQHPERGLVQPLEFISLAEHTGLIKPLTYWVINAALRQCVAWQKQGLGLPVAVNLSAKNLLDPELLERVKALFTTWGCPAGRLQMEITESTLMEDPQRALQVCAALTEMKVQLFIDDFGTGYSSLAYLATLPVHALKIDRAFVLKMAKHPDHMTIVSSTISLAHALGLKVVAEGVDAEDQAETLKALHCDEIQGYLYSPPLPPEKFQEWQAKFTMNAGKPKD